MSRSHELCAGRIARTHRRCGYSGLKVWVYAKEQLVGGRRHDMLADGEETLE